MPPEFKDDDTGLVIAGTKHVKNSEESFEAHEIARLWSKNKNHYVEEVECEGEGPDDKCTELPTVYDGGEGFFE